MIKKSKFNLTGKNDEVVTHHFETETAQVIDLPDVFLRRNTIYNLGDITYSKNLPSYLRLECVKPGTTAATEPDFSGIFGGGGIVSDGTILWIVDDIRDSAQVGDIKFSPILKNGYVKANGGILTNASINYPRLVNYIQNNPSLVATSETIYTHNKNFYYYDSTNDILKLPNYKTDVPLGTVISCMRNTVPENYLLCDGTIYNISDYTDLAEFIKNQFGSYNYFGGDGTTTFAVPDLRGEFLRGTGTNSHANQGSGANVGVHQDGTISGDTRIDGSYNVVKANKGSAFLASNVDARGAWGEIGRVWEVFNSHDTVFESLLYTSRPTNTSVLYCIKYTNGLISQIKY